MAIPFKKTVLSVITVACSLVVLGWLTVVPVFASSSTWTIKTPPNALTLGNGLAGWWTFDGENTDWTANTTADSSGNGNTATLNGMSKTASPAVGKIGQALTFDGSSSYVAAADSTSLDASSVTIAGWFRFNAVNGTFQTGAGKWHVGVNQQYLLQLNNDNKIGFWTGDGSTGASDIESTTTPVAGTWYFIVGAISGSSKSLYINGVLENSGAGASVGSSNAEFSVGSKLNSSGSHFEFLNGMADDVRVYNRALSSSEVVELYNFGTNTHQNVSLVGPGFSNGLIGWWTFDGKETPWTSSTAATTKDTSGSGLDATLNNMDRSTAPALGKVGQALAFDGIDDYAVTSGNIPSGSAFTVSVWVKPNGSQVSNFRLLETDFASGFFLGGDSTGTQFQWIIKNTLFGVGGAVTPGVWTNVVGTYDGITALLYVNGTQVASQSGSGLSPTTALPLYFSTSDQNPGSSEFHGTMDDVRVYNRALSAAEVKSLYKMIAPPLSPAATPSAFIVSGHGTARNDFSGAVGCKFTTSANMTVTALGRLVLSGNTLTHTVYLTAGNGTTITSQAIPTSGITADTYNFVPITPVQLTAGSSYYIVSHEDNGFDTWYDAAPVTVSTGTVDNSAHASSDPSVIFTDDTAGECFGNPNFEYTIP